jgi:hypothetical protein
MAAPNILGMLDLSGFGGGDSPPDRVIDPDGYNLQAQVTIDEDHDDELTITEHPVETGAAITDHAFKRPAEVRLRVGWSNAYVGGDVKQIYESILAVQNWRYPFRVLTGKRQYNNMLVASLRTHTDEKLEFSFVADIVFREIILVDTSTVQGQVGQTLNPQTNAPTTAGGTIGTVPASLTAAQITSYGGAAGIAGPAGSPSGPAAQRLGRLTMARR